MANRTQRPARGKLLSTRALAARLRAIRAVAFDFDGVLTDNRVIVHQDGTEAVVCNRSDGMGCDRLRERGFPLIIISKERNPVVLRRAEKLKMECEHAVDHKLVRLRAFAERHGLTLDQVAYVGNDVNDIECLEQAGLAVAVADAWPDVLPHAHLVLRRAGGMGAVRELADLLCAAFDGARETRKPTSRR